MKREASGLFLDKADLIRMNQLVRKRTDYGRFLDWYQSLNSDERVSLIGELCHGAYQAGVDESVYRVAAEDAGLAQEADFLRMMMKVKGPSGVNVGGLVGWLRSASEPDRVRAFKLFVHLFGEAERRVLQKEDRKYCNHWWHRNLEDPRVVESILSDPEYFKTSPHDDETLSNS